MWYSKSYRRHLCDMHIDDWDERFLSEFSPETYVENLKKANLDAILIETGADIIDKRLEFCKLVTSSYIFFILVKLCHLRTTYN